MNSKNKNLLRWIAVLPGAILIGLLSTIPLHWVLYATFVVGETFSGFNIELTERLLSPFLISLIYIFSGYKIAPDKKIKTSLVLFLLYLILWIIIVVNSSADNFSLSTILALFGGILGLVVVKVLEKKTESK